MPRPNHYRPPIPVTVKLMVLVHQNSFCHATADKPCSCGRKFTAGNFARGEINFDHVPALGLRPWNEDEQDTEPAANDPRHLAAKFRNGCHDPKTYGSRYNRRGSDQYEIRRNKKIERRAEERQAREAAADKGAEKKAEKWAEKVAEKGNGEGERGARVPDYIARPFTSPSPASAPVERGDRQELSRERRPRFRSSRRMQGPGFRTNKDGEWKKPMHGPAVRRIKRGDAARGIKRGEDQPHE
jgi:hypothetical protein